MNDLNWPEFEDLEQAFFVAITPISPALLHGMLTGIVCGSLSDNLWGEVQENLPFFKENESTHTHKNDLIKQLFTLTQESLSELDKPFVLMLASDDMPLAWRLETLADWCDGFLKGIISVYNEAKLSQLPDVLEILNDFSEIKEIAVNAKQTQQNEKDYQELVEFVRVGVQLIYVNYHQPIIIEKNVAVH